MTKATLQATQQVTLQPSQPADYADGRSKIEKKGILKQLTITIGTLSFTIDQEDPPNSSQQLITAYTVGHQLPKPLVPNQPHAIATKPHSPPQINPTNPQIDKRLNDKAKYTATTANKFLKAPPATTEWQKVTRKKINSTVRTQTQAQNRIKTCYYCHKEGHIQKFCWERIKCFTCGKLGHKYAFCPFKPRKPLLRTPPKQPTASIHTGNPLTINQHMDHIHDRPPLGDIFCPPRHFLNDENDYLTKVGLIILINGAPSPQLPRQMAIEIANVHDAHPNDYLITQSTISPYLVICRTKQDRDSVVRGGMYSISQAGVRFIVHEWRPRFGMGYDPPTHQAWVKIVGLPLQAWTMPEITAVLQKFGHPVQIQPFGRDAGHFRDITALIDTNHINQIPLAYVYREGEYSTQVDIYILASRIWTPGYFSPPEDPADQQAQRPQTQQPHHNDHHRRTPTRHPSSSPSNGDPSEPTVDLSASSPRSHCCPLICSQKWLPKAPQFNQKPGKGKNIGPSSRHSSSSLQTYNLLATASAIHLFSYLHIATTNPIGTQNPLGTHSGTRVHLLSISLPGPISSPSLINLNPFPLFRTAGPVRYVTLPQRADLYPHAISHPIAENPPSPLHSTDAQSGAMKEIVLYSYNLPLSLDKGKDPKIYLPRDTSTPPLLKELEGHHNDYYIQDGNMLQPNITIDPIPILKANQPSGLSTLHSYLEAHSCSNKPVPYLESLQSSTRSLADCPAHGAWPILGEPAECTDEGDNSALSHSTDLLLPHVGPRALSDPISADINPQLERDLIEKSLTRCPLLKHTRLSSSASPAPTPPNLSTMSQPKPKGKQPAIRRSQRLQAKRQSTCVSPNLLTPSKSKVAKIAFDLHSHETPLQLNTALTILQASGLQISQKIEEMIEEAVKRNDVNGQMQDPRPQTPLHDAIPPLPIPGEDIVL